METRTAKASEFDNHLLALGVFSEVNISLFAYTYSRADSRENTPLRKGIEGKVVIPTHGQMVGICTRIAGASANKSLFC